MLYDIVDQYKNNKKDKIVSTVDPDSRVAHKSLGTIKRGYKNHIIVDEDSEIILESCTTPFNVVDGLKLKDQDIGQIQMYVNYYTRDMMNEGDSLPMGIILCADKSDSVVKYTLPEDDNQIFASIYNILDWK